MCFTAQISRYLMLVLIVASWLAAQATGAPEILRRYRFIPSRSTVHVTGGFAGLDWPLSVAGRFGLVTGYGPDVEGPTLDPTAQFVDVNAILFEPRALGPIPTPGWDLDETLNLSGLKGTFRDPNLLHFRGEEGQGWPIKLDAALHGRLLHLTGENDPGCCDFFQYKVDAWAHLAPFADFNWDGRVDRTDAKQIMDNFGLAADATFDQGDADGDGDVDGNDFLAWQSQVGDVPEMATLGGASDKISGAVPEPATMLLVLIGFGVPSLLSHRGRRLRHRSCPIPAA